ncbi:ABC transporter substrate-binding protein [Mycolicibacterium celeriflavum]|uniref:metal ABC transporter solute-binding protein, Zn/Mn family n=1 Tax=Mycolicibacterium celeriflavum TaxID=1249101 RepID=UPI0007FFE60D|nr:ABC transporter substrate-binding protein [Mycolicibacterium celeriflavum]
METVIVIVVSTAKISAVRALAVLLLAAPFGLVGCAQGAEQAEPTSAGACPATPVDVVVSVDQWGDIVSDLGGDCARVTTVLASSGVNPHDFEPAPSDAAEFQEAQLVVLNGGHYDEWAAKLAASSAPDAPVVDALAVGGATPDHEGETHDHEVNPHAWYNPATVTAVADAVSARLRELEPGAAGYFDERRAAFSETLRPYDERIDSIRSGASGKSYAATETVFDDMGAALGLVNRTPRGYQVSSANESEPSPADLDAFLQLLADRGVDVLVYNVQTEGAVPQQLRAAAEGAGVPVVDITETVPPDIDSFASWQVNQLAELGEALGVRG